MLLVSPLRIPQGDGSEGLIEDEIVTHTKQGCTWLTPMRRRLRESASIGSPMIISLRCRVTVRLPGPVSAVWGCGRVLPSYEPPCCTRPV